MKRFLFSLILIFGGICVFAQDVQDFEFCSSFNGRAVTQVNVTTARIKPSLVKDKFLLKEGEIFNFEDYDHARKALHDMRIFKTIDFNLTPDGETGVKIDIDAHDGHFVFPLVLAAGGGGSTTVAVMLMEANLFKRGELASIFGAFNSDGFMAAGGAGFNDWGFNTAFADFDYTEEQYADGSFNNSGLFSSGSDDVKEDPVNSYRAQSDMWAVGASKSFHERVALSLGFSSSDVKYSGDFAPADSGMYNKFSAGIKFYRNMKPSKGAAAAFGSIFGLGNSDTGDKISKLPHIRPGYFLGADYEWGGSYTGSDFDISKASLTARGSLELKTRHVFQVYLQAAQTFEGGFFENIKTNDIINKGKYSRNFRGEKGFGGGASVTLLILNNKLGALALEPFAETSRLETDGHSYDLSGAGAGVYYKFRRFPFPLGLNYTRNITQKENTVSFMFGGGF